MNEFMGRLWPQNPQWVHFWSTLEFGREGKTVWVVGFIALFLVVVWFYRRDTASLSPIWKIWLTTLRVGTLAALLLIALMPQQRESRVIPETSRVILLIDNSASMTLPSVDSPKGSVPGKSADVPSRAAAVQAVLEKSALLENLRRTHDVAVFTFSERLQEQPLLEKLTNAQPSTNPGTTDPNAAATASPKRPPNWTEILKPRGGETRLGESLAEMIRRESGDTVSGIVVVTDGNSNAGADPVQAATKSTKPLIAVGTGGLVRRVNLQLAELQAPTHVHVGDGFKIVAYVVAQGLANQSVEVELLSKGEQDPGEPTPVDRKVVTLGPDGTPLAITFDYIPSSAGKRQFVVKTKPSRPAEESQLDDNQKTRWIDAIARKTRILILAGGPMRDYQFARNLLFRDRTIELDVFLQTGSPGISQEAANILFKFPTSRDEMFNYDVIVAFDPDWVRLANEQPDAIPLLTEWVFSHAGGLVLVAGDVHTKELAAPPPAVQATLKPLQDLCPVELRSQPTDVEDDYSHPWPVKLTRAGLEAEFLRLTDSPATSAALWTDFGGIFRCYPSDRPKAGATVYATFADPRSADNPPILLAGQYYGAGRTLYLGSGEMWRLRAVDEDAYDRLWIKLVRDVGQGRLLRGTNRGILLLESKRYPLGATVPVRARILDTQFKDYVAERVILEVVDPHGHRQTPPVELLAVPRQPGQYAGSFVTAIAGDYTLELPIPESNSQAKETLSVELPNLEFEHEEQNQGLLKAISSNPTIGSRYLTLDEMAQKLPGLLPDKTKTKVQFDFPHTLWDRQWVMYALVTLLGLEWLTRKLLKLA